MTALAVDGLIDSDGTACEEVATGPAAEEQASAWSVAGTTCGASEECRLTGGTKRDQQSEGMGIT